MSKEDTRSAKQGPAAVQGRRNGAQRAHGAHISHMLLFRALKAVSKACLSALS